jgi:hypothetical protein
VSIKLGGVHINENALRVKVGGSVFLLKQHVYGMQIVSSAEKEGMYIHSLFIEVPLSQRIMYVPCRKRISFTVLTVE